MIADYFNYISGIVGAKALVVAMFFVAVIGPCCLYKMVNSQLVGWKSKLKWCLAAVTYFSCLILFITIGGFVGKQFDYPALGMGAGLVAFYFAYNAFTSLLPSTCPIEVNNKSNNIPE